MSHIAQIHEVLSPPRGSVWRRFGRAIFWISFLLLFAWLGWSGWNLRAWVWETSQPIRFRGDINNGFSKGLAVYETAKRGEAAARDDPVRSLILRFAALAPAKPGTAAPEVPWDQFVAAYLKTYDLAADNAREVGGIERYALDYTPLRLFVISVWVKLVKEEHPNARHWREEYTPFMLHVNSGFEIAGALMIGVLVWDTLRRSHRPKVFLHEIAQDKARLFRSGDRALLAGAIAAMIFWFNPSNLLDAHAWPQWDIWLVPFYLLAMWLALREKFFFAGVAIAIGAMFKGQILLAAPVFVLWPMFQLRFGRAVGVIVGFICGLLLCAAAWLVPTREAWVWIACVAPMMAIFATSGKAPNLGWSWWLAAVIASGLIVWPWLNEDHVLQIFLPLAFAAIACVLPTLLPKRAGFGIFIFLLCGALVLSAYRYEGSWNWFKIGFIWPTQQYKTMVMGYTCNLAWLLQNEHIGVDTVWYQLNLPSLSFAIDVTTRHLLLGAYAVTLSLCGLGAAIHSARRDPRVLISLAAPWILAFALLSQMHERYLTWAAAILGVGCAVSVGLTLLQMLVISISSAMILNDMIYANGGATLGEWGQFFGQYRQGMTWALLLTALIYLYVAAAPHRTADHR